jgi:hypothetical protein
MTNTAYVGGSTDVTVYIRGFTTATGAEYTAGLHSTPTLVLQYVRNRGASTTTGFAPITQTASGAHADGGFVHVVGGVYRVDIPDAAVAAGADSVRIVATGISTVTFTTATIEITGANPRSATTDANVTKINSVTVVGAGTSGDKWRA